MKEKIERWLSGQKHSSEKALFFLLLLFLPTQLGKHFWPPFSLLLGIRIDYLSPTLFLTDILIVSLLLIWVRGAKARAYLIQTITHHRVLWGLLLLILLTGLFTAKDTFLFLYGVLKVFEYGLFGLYIAKSVNIKRDLTAITLCFAVSGLFEAVLGIVQFFNQGSVGGLLYFLGERSFTGQTPGIANASLNGTLVLRPYATFPHPNVLAGYLLIVSVLIAPHLQSITGKARIFFIGTFLIVSCALLLTLSRVALILWIIFMGSIFLKKLFLQKGHAVWKKGFFLFGLALFILLLLYSPLAGRFSTLSLASETYQDRVLLIMQATEMIQQHPLFGVGLLQFLPTLAKTHLQSSHVLLQPVHNILFLTAAETGIAGLGMFIWIIVRGFRQVLSLSSAKNVRRYFLWLLIIIMILGQFDHYFLTLQQGQIVMTVVLGLCFATSSSRSSKKNSS